MQFTVITTKPPHSVLFNPGVGFFCNINYDNNDDAFFQSVKGLSLSRPRLWNASTSSSPAVSV